MHSVKSINKKKAEKREILKKMQKKIKLNLLFQNIMLNYMHIFNLSVMKMPKAVLGWRNWQTRTVEVRMERSLGVQVPPRVPKSKFFMSLI